MRQTHAWMALVLMGLAPFIWAQSQPNSPDTLPPLAIPEVLDLPELEVRAVVVQTPASQPAVAEALAAQAPKSDGIAEASHPSGPSIWGSLEYLLWWEKSAPVAAPLVTANAAPGAIGSLNEAGTVILFGPGSGRSTDFDPFSGGRLTLGSWLGPNQIIGLEGSGFLFQTRNTNFNAASPGPVAVSIPFNATQPFTSAAGVANPAGETSFNSGGTPNVVSVNLASQMWGAEVNELVNLAANRSYRLATIIGFRYFDLRESLNLNDATFDTAAPGVVTVTDNFATRNEFYGGQLGLRAGGSFGRLTVDVTGKAAFGANHEISNISGLTTVTNGAFGFATGATLGGVFAQPSNIGHTSRNAFALVPEGQLQIGYLLTRNIHPFIGYNFLYVSDVLRPGNQIDRNINFQTPVFIAPGTTVGPLAPLPAFRASDFWAQGVNLGVEIRF
jgi:Putative beta barrel porin-7 (BBP7)